MQPKRQTFYGEAYVLREAEHIKNTRQAFERDLGELNQRKQRITDLDGPSERVHTFCAQVAERLDEFNLTTSGWPSMLSRLRSLPISTVSL